MRVLAGVAVGVVAITGCTEAAGESSPPDDRPTSAADPDETAPVAERSDEGSDDPDREEDDQPSSPLAEYLGKGSVTLHPNGMSMSLGGDRDEPTEADVQQQRAATYGYGITTVPVASVLNDPADPNQEIMASLSPEALAEYERALYGIADPDGDGNVQPLPEGERGCQGRAAAEPGTSADGSGATDRVRPEMEFSELLDDIFALSDRLQADPRLVEANERWADCMAGAGYPDLERVGAAEESVNQRVFELGGLDVLAPADDGNHDGEAAVDPAELAERAG